MDTADTVYATYIVELSVLSYIPYFTSKCCTPDRNTIVEMYSEFSPCCVGGEENRPDTQLDR